MAICELLEGIAIWQFAVQFSVICLGCAKKAETGLSETRVTSYTLIYIYATKIPLSDDIVACQLYFVIYVGRKKSCLAKSASDATFASYVSPHDVYNHDS